MHNLSEVMVWWHLGCGYENIYEWYQGIKRDKWHPVEGVSCNTHSRLSIVMCRKAIGCVMKD